MTRALAVLLVSSLARAAPAPPVPMPARLLRTLAHDPQGYDPSRHAAPSDVLLGDLLYHSPEILGGAARARGLSCQTCHPNGATHRTLVLDGISDKPGNVDLTSGQFRAGADDGIDDAVNIPSLRGVRYTSPYGRDGRTASLAEFTRGVVEGEFGGAPLAPSDLAALVRYEEELDFLPNRLLDETGRLRATAGEGARRGEALFLGKAGCAACHVPSSFFRDGRVHRVGSGRPASPYSLDDGFETPTLLGLAETAPYLHDGRFATLAEVVDFFDGRLRLGLSAPERADLVAYLAAVGAVDTPADDRPRGRALVETFAYLALALDGDVRDRRDVWRLAVARVREALAAPDVPPDLRAEVKRLDGILSDIARRADAGAPLPSLRPEIARTHAALVRLAADWQGRLHAH